MAKKEKANIALSIKDLLEAGAHYGHQTHRWNPKMKPYILEARNGIHLIDLSKTLQLIREAVNMIDETVSQQHQSVLFVGTKKQAKDVVREVAERCGEFYVCERWLGGMLTNLTTIRNSIKKMERFEKKIAQGGDGLTKKEILMISREQEKLEKNLSGVRAMRKLPGLLIVVDSNKEHLAVAEARKLGIPVLALVDTNCDPDDADHVIPCNDDALKSIQLILNRFGDTIQKRKQELRIAAVKRGEEKVELAEEFSIAAKDEETVKSGEGK